MIGHFYRSLEEAKFTSEVHHFNMVVQWERTIISSTWTSVSNWIALRNAGCSKREIGRIMGGSHTTISQELGRNSLLKAGYKPARAAIMAQVRRDRPCKLQRLSTLRVHVHARLATGWSPEQISGRLRHDGSKHTLSHETIYRYIYRREVRKHRLYRYLPHAKAKCGLRCFKRRREPLPERMNIANRSRAIETRQQFGHREGDLLQFRTRRGAVLNVTERSTRFSLLSSLPNKRAADTGQAIVDEMGGGTYSLQFWLVYLCSVYFILWRDNRFSGLPLWLRPMQFLKDNSRREINDRP